MNYSQTITLHQELITTADALDRAAKGLKRIASVLTKASKIDPDQAWFWTKEWQEGEKQADEDIRLGRYTTYESADDLIADLDKAAKKYRRAHCQK